ncbi:MAG: DNA adenine methylase [Eubacteriales bacterium]|nr:DNA adenine methylase [Eubacteriales bacterium]
MPKNKPTAAAPIVKWAGGKRQLLDALLPLLPPCIGTYCEPFVGGGALLFRLQPAVAFVNDINQELMALYRVVRDDVDALIDALRRHPNDAAHFYAVRSWDRDGPAYARRDDVQKAARLVYLNKTCYNGLFRVNGAGQFNTPFGHYRNPNIVNAAGLTAVSAYLNSARVTLSAGDYASVLEGLPAGAFVYLDPPYDPLPGTAGFTGYAKDGFTRDDQIRLRQCCDRLDARNIRFMLSNSATAFIREQYAHYHISVVRAKRAVNSDPSKRGEVDEIVVRNYR